MFNVEHIIQTGGIAAIAAIIFAESGLLIGFFLPGDTLLFSAGILAAGGRFNIAVLAAAVIAAAIVGDNVGYSIGKKLGPKLFTKKDGVLFRHEYVARSEKFFASHGGKTVTLARFVPIVRTFTPMIAGAGNMPRNKFMAYNIVGGIVWGGGLTLLGYFLGSKIPNVEHYIQPIMVIAILITFGPTLYHLLKDNKLRGRIKRLLSRASRPKD